MSKKENKVRHVKESEQTYEVGGSRAKFELNFPGVVCLPANRWQRYSKLLTYKHSHPAFLQNVEVVAFTVYLRDEVNSECIFVQILI